MAIPRSLKIGASILLVGAFAFTGLRCWRGPVGASTEYGGTLEARQLPDFTSTDAARWVNGAPAPLAKLRGEVVFIEAWAPA